jgi:hypothetical protein
MPPTPTAIVIRAGSQIDRQPILVDEAERRLHLDPQTLLNPVSYNTGQFHHVTRAGRFHGAETVRVLLREPRPTNLELTAIRFVEKSESTAANGVVEQGLGRPRLPLAALSIDKEDPSARWRGCFRYQLQAGPHDNPAIEIEFDPRLPLVAFDNADMLDHSPWPNHFNPVEDTLERALSPRSAVDRAANRTANAHQVVETRHTGACRGATHLCQVGTTTRHRTVQVEFPETQGSTEIDHRYTETPIRRYETTAASKYQPTLAVGCEHVDCPLKPVSTATSDQDIG